MKLKLKDQETRQEDVKLDDLNINKKINEIVQYELALILKRLDFYLEDHNLKSRIDEIKISFDQIKED